MPDLFRRTFLQWAALVAAACGGNTEGDEATPPPTDPTRPGAPGEDGGPSPDAGPIEDGGPKPPVTVPGEDLDMIPGRAASFPYGVMAGDATSTNAMLWTQLVGAGTLHVQIEAEDTVKGQAVVSRAVDAKEKGDGGFVHVDAAGLQPGKKYRYAFFLVEGGKPVGRSAIGYVRAALAPNALEVITFGGTSCTHQIQGAPYPILADAGKRKLDFFIHCGDHVYCDAETDAVTLAQYRTKYSQAWAASGMRALHGSTGMVLTWDDHEILNNWDPETLPAARVDAARRAFFEHRALRRDPAAPNRVWRNLVWGNTLEILVLDARSERKPSTRAAANAQFISAAQMTWLKDRLKQSTAVFKLVVTSVPITNFPATAGADKWEGYPAQRNALLNYVAAEKIAGVFWLSGDLHFASAGGVEATGVRRQMIEILMGPGGTNAGDPNLSPEQFDLVVNQKNYALFKADPVKKELTVEYIGAGGASISKKTYKA